MLPANPVLNYLALGFSYFVLFGLLFSIYDFVNQPAFFVNMVALFLDDHFPKAL